MYRRKPPPPRTAVFSLEVRDLAPAMVPQELDDEPLVTLPVGSPSMQAAAEILARYPDVDAAWIVEVVRSHLR